MRKAYSAVLIFLIIFMTVSAVKSLSKTVINNTKMDTSYTFTSEIDGEVWNCTGSDNQYWVNGNSYFYTDKGPYILFKFTKPNDLMASKSENILIIVSVNNQNTGVYSGDKIEVLFQGYQGGKELMYGHKFPALKSDNLKVEITKYQDIDNGKAEISGKINGKILRSLCPDCKPDVMINGTFDNTTATIYTER